MKLLVLIHRLPCPPDRGAKLRAAAELRYLARRHEVWCAGFLDDRGDAALKPAVEASLSELHALCRGVAAVPLRPALAGARAAAALLTGSTATESYFRSRQLTRQVMEWSDQVGFDAVLAFSSSMAPLALRVPAHRHVVDLVDLDSRKWDQSADETWGPKRWIYRTEARRLDKRERDWIAAFDTSVLVNDREAALLDDAALRERVEVIETGAWSDGDAAARSAQGRSRTLPAEPNIGFIGAMDYGPNIQGVRWFARTILPRIREHRPDAVFWIIGRSPARAVRELDDGRTIRVTGTVPAVEPYLGRLRVSVAPLQLARGVQTKVLTAMAEGIPCVVTPCVAEGIGAAAAREMLVESTPQQFAAAVLDLLNQPAQARSIGEAGRRFVASRFHPVEGLARLESLLRADYRTRRLADAVVNGGENAGEQAAEDWMVGRACVAGPAECRIFAPEMRGVT
jgi:sugar transferase (PEP-CTERM/EpsH1 system associated)